MKDKFRARVQREMERRLEEMRQRNECPEERTVEPLLKVCFDGARAKRPPLRLF